MTIKTIKFIIFNFFLAAFFGCSSFSSQSIKTIYSFEEAHSELATADAQTLVIFDVDDTLISQSDEVLKTGHRGSPFTKALFNKIHQEGEKHPDNKAYRDRIGSKIKLQARRQLIEPMIAGLIKQLQDKGVKVIALTHMHTGPYGVIPNVEEWRYQDLHNFGIDFSRDISDDMIFDTFPEFRGHYPRFYKGILITHNRSKGEVLGAFLDKISWKPKKIIFFDDWMDYLKTVQEETKKRNITCSLYHYLGAEKLVKTLDEHVATFQIEHMIKTETWLDDEQVQAALKHSSQKHLAEPALP